MGVGRSLLKLIVGGSCVLGSLALASGLSGAGLVFSTALGNVAAGNTANAIDALLDGGEGGVSLENQDLTKAVGKAIAAVITLAAKQQRGKTRQHLEKIAAQAKDNWVELAQQELTQQRYPDLREAQLDQFLTPQEYQLTQQGNLTATEWGDIFIRLNMAACTGGGFSIPSEVRQQVAELLHTTFPKALRETFKEDFAKDGKAWAGLTLQLLTGMQAQLSQLQASQGGVDTEELAQILEQFQEVETQLRGSVTQQQAFFNQISHRIESGFTEVCQRLGVMETTITGLLQTLEERLKDLHQDVREFRQEVQQGFESLHNQPRGRSLSPEEWQNVCRQNLVVQKQVTTNPFTNPDGVEAKLEDIYVPLAILERKASKQVRTSEQDPQEKSQETLTPITEESFFEEVLRQSKSAISQGRKIAIIGEPGSGKTTRLQKIADWILEQGLGLPIFIYLRDVNQPTITQYINEVWLNQTGQGLTLEALMEHKQRIWLLLDGLDEMTTRLETHHVSAWLGGWVQDVRVVVTCRVNVWEAERNAFSGFDVFRNLELSGEQVGDYIRCWFGVTGNGAPGESLAMALGLSENARLRELVQNPLRLWMLCQIWGMGGVLPETQAALYEQFVNWVYRWKADEEILDERETINGALARLALTAMESGDEGWRLRLREGWVLKVLGSRSIFRAVERLGWLNRVERFPEAIYVFYHATFQEYFAALAVEDWDYWMPTNHVDCPVEGKRYRVFEPQWKQVILLWLGREDITDGKKEEFIQALVKFEDGSMGLYWFHAVFIAAAGIGEFKTCSQVDVVNAIVKQIVKWGFGYYNQEKQEWWGYFNQIQKDARKTILQTNRKRAVQELYQILEHPQCHEYSRRLAVYTLQEIGQGNQTAIAGLVKILETAEEKYTRQEAASCLCKIGQGNQTAISELVRIIETTEDEYTRQRNAENLGEIDPGNQTAIADLVKILEKTEYTRSDAAYNLSTIGEGLTFMIYPGTDYEFTRMEAAKSLGEIDPGNQTAIAALVKVIETTEDEWIRMEAAKSLGEIDPGNQTAIAALVKVIETTEEKYTRQEAAKSLGEIDPGNQTAIAALVKVIQTTEDTYTRQEAAKSLGEIDPGNQTAIAALVKVIQTTEDEWIRMEAAESLEEIDPGNQTVIAALVKALETTGTTWIPRRSAHILKQIGQGNQTVIAELLRIFKATEDEDTRIEVAFCLWGIDPGNQTTISELLRDLRIAKVLRIFEAIEDENTHWQAAESLEEIDPGNETEIAELLRILETAEDESPHRSAAYSLEKILTTPEQYAGVVTALKHNLSDEVYQNNFDRFSECYKLIWNCAKNLPYPEFYQAWHHPTTTPHPEVEDNTPVASTPFTQHCNLALFPQILNQTNQSHPLNRQIICIDGSRFSDPSNPALQIYTTLKKAGCPPINDKPRTIAELQAYCDDDLSNHNIALILYEEPTDPPPQGFDIAVLNQLGRFSHPPIAVILPQLLTDCRLPQFLESDPNLVTTILQWLQNLER